MDLTVSQARTADGTRRVLTISNLSSGPDRQIFFDLVGEVLPPPAALDAFLFSTIFFAMKLKEPIRVRGPLTRDCLQNLVTFQEAWELWLPKKYSMVDIEADEVISSRSETAANAIAAYSGGVDSIFTLLRHKLRRYGEASYQIGDSVMTVHGFDVPLNFSFDALTKTTDPILNAVGVKRRVLRTNLKEELHWDTWDDSSMAALSACLSQYSHEFAYGLAGSTEPYNSLVLPFGSNPATDYLLSGGHMQLVHDGAAYNRTQKVALLAEYPEAIRSLKVCFENGDISKNCGICEKCVRTRLNFKAVGIDDPECFEQPFDVSLVDSLYLLNTLEVSEFSTILDYAKARGLNEPWMHALQRRIDAFRPRSPLESSVTARRLRKLLLMLRRGQFSDIGEKLLRRMTTKLPKIGR